LRHYVIRWHVLGPFPSQGSGRVRLDQRTAVEDELERRGDGSVDVTAPVCGGRGSTMRWKPLGADRRGFVDLAEALGPADWVIGYAYAEVESAAARPSLLRCGSDDGIKVWLNGQAVHANEVGREYLAGSDETPVTLRAGVNRLLVKVDNYQGCWGFGLELAPAGDDEPGPYAGA
jgi:hypothetical protein